MTTYLQKAYQFSEKLFAKLQAFRTSLRAETTAEMTTDSRSPTAARSIREEFETYETDADIPF